MIHPGNFQSGYPVATPTEDREGRTTPAIGPGQQSASARAAIETEHAGTRESDADKIVGELVRQYLRCSSTMSGTFFCR